MTITSEYFQEDGFKSLSVLVNEKKEFFISKGKCTISVLNKNASHRAFKGAGRTFYTWEEALESYKSVESKAAIREAMEFLS
jgi:hypothetical protein